MDFIKKTRTSKRSKPIPFFRLGLIFLTIFIIAVILVSIKVSFTPLNVVLISMDTLRGDHLGSYGYPVATSPNIDRLAKEGVLFRQAFSPAPWTTSAHMSLFSGLYPVHHGLTEYSTNPDDWVKVSSDIPLLAEIIRDDGYKTVGFTGSGYIGSEFGFNRGFNQYKEVCFRLEGYHDNLKKWLQNEKNRPYFLFLHFYNCHRPYEPPDPYNEMFHPNYNPEFELKVKNFCIDAEASMTIPDPALINYAISQYDGEIRYADYELETHFRFLKETKLDRNTIIIFLSDHGEEFFEHGNCDHLKSLYDSLLHVPIIFSGPGIQKNVIVSTMIELTDVASTILDLLNIPNTLKGEGDSFLSSLSGETKDQRPKISYGETSYKRYRIKNGEWFHDPYHKEKIRSLRSTYYKVVYNEKSEPIEFYNIDRDPDEHENLFEKKHYRKPVVLKFQKKLDKLLHAPEPQSAPLKSINRSDTGKLIDKLETLGYIK